MVDGASWLRANLPQFALVDAIRDDGFGGVLARFELRPLRLFRGVGLLLSDFDILVARNGLLSLWLLPVGRADLDKFWLGRDLLLNVRLQLCRIAGRIGALCGIWANCKSFPLARCRHATRVSQQATQPTAPTGIGNGAPSSAGSVWGAQQALVNLDRSACIVLSSQRTESVSLRIRAAPACFGTTIL